MSKLGATPITAPDWTGKPKDGVAIVDCDVHHNLSNPEQRRPYMSKFYRTLFDRSRDAGQGLSC